MTKLVEKIIQFFRSLFSKKTDNSISKKNLKDSKFKSIVLKAWHLFYKYLKFFIILIYKYLKKFVTFILNSAYSIMQPMIKISKKHPIAFWAAVIFHLSVLFALLYTNVDDWEATAFQQKLGANESVIETVMIDYEIVDAAVMRIKKEESQKLKKLKNEEKKKEQKLKNEEKRSEIAKKDLKKAKQDALLEKARKAMAIVQRESEEAKTKEAEILASKANEIIADAETKTKIEEAKAKKAEVKRMTEEAKTKEAEILVQEAAKKIELAEAKRIAEELKLKVAEAKRIALEIEIIKAEVKQSTVEAKTKEAELLVKEVEKQLEEHKQNKAILEQEIAALKLAEEEIQYIRLLIQEVQEEQDAVKSIILEDRLSKLKTAYIMNIAARIKTFWRYQGAEDDWTCEVYVIQDRQGQVNAVDVRNCNGGNSSLAKSFMNSIERAVYKASPLPAAPDESVFDSELYMLFSVN